MSDFSATNWTYLRQIIFSEFPSRVCDILRETDGKTRTSKHIQTAQVSDEIRFVFYRTKGIITETRKMFYVFFSYMP